MTIPEDVRSKRTKGEDYPLAAASSLGKGWAEQADWFADYLTGRTPDEVKKLKTDENGKPQDADLVSGCTIAVDRYRDAVVRACEQAKALGAAQGDRVTLSLIAADLPQDLAATDDQDAHVRADITLAALTVDGEGRVTSAIGDMTQPQLTVSADGTVSGPEEPVYTKNEQGDKYGMREASALHKEWYEHAEGYCSTLKGKTMAEIAAQPTDGSDADLKALCTISVTDLQKAEQNKTREGPRAFPRFCGWNYLPNALSVRPSMFSMPSSAAMSVVTSSASDWNSLSSWFSKAVTSRSMLRSMLCLASVIFVPSTACPERLA